MLKSAVLILLGALTLFGAGEYSNRRAPGFSLADSQFVQHDPQDYRGKVLIVEFMQTTCPVCTHLADTLLQIQTKYGDKIGVLSVTTLPDNFQTAAQFAKDHKIPWPILFDSGQVMMSYLKVTPANPTVHFPHIFIIDGNGTIRFDFESGLEADEISAQIDKLLK